MEAAFRRWTRAPSGADGQPSLDGAVPDYESAIDNPPDCDVRRVVSPVTD
jgi:hypothetical protein